MQSIDQESPVTIEKARVSRISPRNPKSEIRNPQSPHPRYLVLTVDYEIFGNGTGDVRQHMIEPAERMAKLGDRFGTPFTFFVEVEEYLAFEKYRDELIEALGYDPAALIREQIQSLIQRGHDIQLHLHPQWYGAKFQSGKWILNKDQHTVDNLFETQEETTRYISERKRALEEIIHEVDPKRSVKAYRAGAFCAQPGRKLLTALAETGIKIESSVVRGMFRPGESVSIDYRRTPASRSLWPVKAEVCEEDPSGEVFEIPIHSRMGRRFMQIGPGRLRAKFSKNVPKEKQKELLSELGISGNPLGLVKFLWERVPIKADFHNLSAGTLLRWVRAAQGNGGSPLDIAVLIGHSKEHISDDVLNRFLGHVSQDPKIEVVTLDWMSHSLVTPS